MTHPKEAIERLYTSQKPRPRFPKARAWDAMFAYQAMWDVVAAAIRARSEGGE